MAKHTVISGGGVAGLVAALMALRSRPGNEIIVIEKAKEYGGLLKTFDYGGGRKFDCGMHFWTDTGIDDLDAAFTSLLPADDWVHLQGAKRDLSGLYYRGRLQLNSQFPDLRQLPKDEYRACLADFFSHVGAGALSTAGTETKNDVQSYLRDRFGPLIADRYVAPIAEKVHGKDAGDLDAMARFLPLIDRIVMFDEDAFARLMGSDLLRARMAYPEQRRLPLQYSSGRSSIYPKAYGIGRVITALVARLRAAGVIFMNESTVSKIYRRDGRIDGVTVQGGGGEKLIDDIDAFVWANNCLFLAPLLGLDMKQFAMDRPRKTVLVNVLLDRPPASGDLYCLFCADKPFATYRVTNYAAYCPDVAKGGQFPISVEMILPAEDTGDADAMCRRAIDEVTAMGLIEAAAPPLFAAAEFLPGGFPTISRRNIAAIDTIRTEIQTMDLKNLLMVGILASLIYSSSIRILSDIYRKMA